ncbi:MAG: LysM peptidoglycan-binding domain-containing protein [Chloroflexi bacterium]|nr:LysM peptidoglycan-binding domain-containing protein [Chloroflexota bacterium]
MKRNLILPVCLVFFLAACNVPQADYSASDLTPYGKTAVLATGNGSAELTPTPFPTPSPTPNYHIVQAGETMSSIALLYGLNMADVIQANPEINPNAMVVGMQILIPPKSASTAEVISGSTPAPVLLSEPNCYREKSGGLWCFMEAKNENESAVENVLVEITIGDEGANVLAAQTAAAPLNMIPSGAALPLSAYFPPPVPEPYRYSYQLVSALPVENADRYVETSLLDESRVISADGLTGQVTARVFVNGVAGETVQVWLAVVAQDTNGNIVGVRRIEKIATLDDLGVIEMSGFIYSAGNPMVNVDLLVEAIYSQ